MFCRLNKSGMTAGRVNKPKARLPVIIIIFSTHAKMPRSDELGYVYI